MPLIRKDAGKTVPAGTSDPLVDLQSTSSATRWAAARQLAQSPASVGPLGRALSMEADPRVREALFTSLAHIQSPEAITAVLVHIRSDDAAIRAGALDALNAMSGAVENYIPSLLADPDPDVRILSCDVVRLFPADRATKYLCNLLNDEAHPNVCGAAVEALCEVGNETALPILARCAERFSSEPFLVFAIRTASKRIAGDESIGGARPV